MSGRHFIVTLAGIVLLMTCFLPTAPQDLGIGEQIFGALVVLIVLGFVFKVLTGRCYLPRSYVYAPLGALIYLAIFSSWPSLVVNNVSLWSWIRGLVPIALYVIFVPLICAAKTVKDLSFLINSLLMSAFIISTFGLHSIIDVGRWWRAYLPPHVYQPHIVAAFAYLMGCSSEVRGVRKVMVWVLALFFFGIILITESRSLIALAVLSGIAGLIRSGFSLKKIFLLSIAMAFIGIVIYVRPNFGGYFDPLSRFANKGVLDVTRVEELRAVLAEFAKSPLFGNGLGYQYTYTRTAIGLVWQGGYTHNLITYFLLTTGLFGISVLFWIAWSVSKEIVLSLRALRYSSNQEVRSLFWGSCYALVVTALYALFQSIFRGLSFPLIVSFCLVVIIKVRTVGLQRG